jgi:hypothetical protein
MDTPAHLGLRLTTEHPPPSSPLFGEGPSDHDLVIAQDRLLANLLMTQRLGTAVEVQGLGQHYFLVQTGPETVSLFCAPSTPGAALGAMDYEEAMEAHLVAYQGERLSDMAASLSAALASPSFSEIDYEVARTCALGLAQAGSARRGREAQH